MNYHKHFWELVGTIYDENGDPSGYELMACRDCGARIQRMTDDGIRMFLFGREKMDARVVPANIPKRMLKDANEKTSG